MLHSKKRGQGLSLTIIVVALLALIVAAVLIMIFTGKIGEIRKSADELGEKQPCPNGYEGKISATCKADDTLYGNFDVSPGFVCCKTSAENA